MAKKDFQIDEGQIKDQLDTMLRDIHESEDPSELDEYRRLFKKHVSVFKRGYAAAYMLKYFKAEGGRKQSNRRRRSETDENMVSVFIGIGRTRRVYPRDLVGLILDNTKLSREDIGNIKILDNYSFADINSAKAEEVISVLNDSEYRGRNLNVNYAKKKT
jgi:ATP-dependent RNA helicase DeaD